MKTLNFRDVPRLLVPAIAIPLVLLVVSGAMLRWSWQVNAAASRAVARSYETIVDLKDVLTSLTVIEAAERDFVLTTDARTLQTYRSGQERLRQLTTDLAEDTEGNPGQRARIDELRSWLQVQMAALDRNVRLQSSLQHEEAMNAVRAEDRRTGLARIRELVDAAESGEGELLLARREALARNRRHQAIVAAVVLVVELAFGLTTVLLVRRVMALRRMVTVCAWSKQIKVGDRWLTLEQYLHEELNLRTTHGISPEVARKLMADFEAQAEPKPADHPL